MENKNTFRNAKIGDRVWSFANNWGTIVEIDTSTFKSLIVVFDNRKEYKFSYYEDGKSENFHPNPSLFWDEIKFEIPKKPFDLKAEFEKLEVKEFEDERMSCFIGTEKGKWLRGSTYTFNDLTSIYFRGNENFINFIALLNEHKITPEQLRPLLLEKLIGKKEIAGTEFIIDRFNKVK